MPLPGQSVHLAAHRIKSKLLDALKARELVGRQCEFYSYRPAFSVPLALSLHLFFVKRAHNWMVAHSLGTQFGIARLVDTFAV